MARQEIEEAMSNFYHPENPGSSHWLGCACSESAWAEKLAAAEAKAAAVPGLRLRVHELEQANREAEASWLVENNAKRAAEERARMLEEALRHFANVAPLLSDHESDAQLVVGWSGLRGTGRLNHGDFRRAVAALAPPPEAEKRGEG